MTTNNSTPTLIIMFNRMRTIDYSATTYDDFCAVCGRHTDHFAEHDDLVDLGWASYETTTTYFTTSDGRTVHPNIESTVSRSPDAYSRSSDFDAERRVLYAAQREQWTTELSGQVSLVKPVGVVITARS